MKRYGSRAEVWHGNAKMTTGRLSKKDLLKNKQGRIVSRTKIKHMKDPNKNPLLKLGYQRKKGSKEFGPNNLDETNNNSNKKKINSNKNKTNSNKNKTKTKKNKNKSFLNKISNLVNKIVS